MAVSEELKIVIKAEAQNAITQLNKTQKASKGVEGNFKGIARSLMGRLGVAAGFALLAKGASDFVKEGVRFNMQLEQLAVSFETILGSTGAATDMMKQLADFSASTPLQLANLAEGAKRLIAFGTEAEDVVDTMRDLGNAAMGNAGVLDRLVLAYGKVQAKGRASLEELNMFTEAGVPLMAELGKNLGLTNEELFKFVSAGKVGFKEVDEALQSLTRGEGQFAGLLEKQSKTLAGATSTLKDTFGLLRAEMTEKLSPALTDMAIGLTDVFNAMRSDTAAANAYKRVLSETTIQVKELSAAEELAFQQSNLRDWKTIFDELAREFAIESGDSGVWRKGWKDFWDVMSDKGFVTTIGLGKEMAEVQRVIDGVSRRIGTLKTEIAGGIVDVPIPGAVDPLSLVGDGGGGAAAGNAFGKTFFSELVDMAGDERFYFIPEAEEGGAEAGAAFGKSYFAELVGMAGDKRFFFDPDALPVAPDVDKWKYLEEAVRGYTAALKEASDVQVNYGNTAYDFMQQVQGLEVSFVDITKELKDGFVDVIQNEALDAMSSLGASFANGEDMAASMTKMFNQFMADSLKTTSRLLLEAGLARLVFSPYDPIGWAMVIGSGLAAFAGGAMGSKASGASSLPDSTDSASVARSGSTFGKGNAINVTINNANTVMAEDDLKAQIVGAVAEATSGH